MTTEVSLVILLLVAAGCFILMVRQKKWGWKFLLLALTVGAVNGALTLLAIDMTVALILNGVLLLFSSVNIFKTQTTGGRAIGVVVGLIGGVMLLAAILILLDTPSGQLVVRFMEMIRDGLGAFGERLGRAISAF